MWFLCSLRTTTLNSSPSEFKPKVPVLQPASSLTTYPLAKVLLSKASNALKSNSENRQKISKSPIPKLVVSKNHQEDITNASTEKEKKFDDNVWGIFRTRENFSDMHICWSMLLADSCETFVQMFAFPRSYFILIKNQCHESKLRETSGHTRGTLSYSTSTRVPLVTNRTSVVLCPFYSLQIMYSTTSCLKIKNDLWPGYGELWTGNFVHYLHVVEDLEVL